MERSALSLKWLEVFQAVSRRGSVREGAAELGISVSTVSHHLSCLERAVGTPLLDHSKRPMRPTAEGEVLLRRVDEALGLLRKGVAEIWTDDLRSLARVVRIAHVEDFDSDVGPELTAHLARALPACEFSLLTRPSHEVVQLLRSDHVDIGIASSAETDLAGIVETPLLRDPFVLVMPLGAPDAVTTEELVSLGSALPFLRYSREQVMGRRVAAQLARQGVKPQSRMEFESTHEILAMVAAGQGWAITTALNYARGRRYQERVRMRPLPDKPFARRMNVYERQDLPAGLHELVMDAVRATLRVEVIAPTVARHGWLAPEFHLLGDD
ncbi:MAG: LysR family transcriptional regulator [Pseudomonadota bacterium]